MYILSDLINAYGVKNSRLNAGVGVRTPNISLIHYKSEFLTTRLPDKKKE